MRRFFFIAGAILCLGSQAIAQTKPAGLILTNRGWIRPQTIASWNDLIDIQAVDTKLRATASPKGTAAKMLWNGRQVAASIGNGGVWEMYRIDPKSKQAPGVASFSANRIDLPSPDMPLHLTRIAVVREEFHLVGRGATDAGHAALDITLLPDGSCGILIQVADKQILNEHVTSFGALMASQPVLMRLYVRPLFTGLGHADLFAAPAADVYRTFTEIDPDADTIGAFEAIVPLLGDADPTNREAGQHQLAALGRRGVLAALRRGRGDLNDQQLLTIDALLVANTDAGRIAPPRGDPLFLIDCLTDEDARVRAIAKVALERMYGRKIAIDPATPTALATEARKILHSMNATPAGIE